jgi:hypothetical protein
MDVVDRVRGFIRKRHKSTGAPTRDAAALSFGNLAELSIDEKDRYVRTLLSIAVADGRISEAALARMY